MQKLEYKIFCAIVCGMMYVIVVGSAYSRDNAVTLKQIQEAIMQVATMKDQVFYQSDKGPHLANLTKKVDPKKVDIRTLRDLESLLDSDNDLTRYWGAVAIGNLGPHAKVAVPKLLKTLSKVDCLNGVITSADGIRYALKRIGVKPPPQPKCVRISA
ncbi:MAG: hypothetical protein ACRDHZ_19585 [Ktedonobacteraceae bacterium]